MKYPAILLSLAVLALSSLSLHAQIEGREYEEVGKPQDAQKVLKFFPENSQVKFAKVPMRDGVKLATNVFIPPGEGPWPVIFARGYYGRYGTSYYARPCKDGEFVFVIQDARGKGDSEGKGTYDPASFKDEVPDCYDSLEWISKQPWCNGKIAMTGGSGNGIGVYTAFLSGHPSLVAATAGNSSGSSLYWMYDNRVRRWLYSWMTHRGLNTSAFPRPTLTDNDAASTMRELQSYKVNPDTVLNLGAGWYDIVSESALDYFSAFSKKAKVYVKVSPNRHMGAVQINDQKHPHKPALEKSPSITDVLLGQDADEPSYLMYYLMGDVFDASAPGNEWRVTHEWPVEHTPMSLYLTQDGGLQSSKPSTQGRLQYVYDPADPAPSIGGNGTYDAHAGAFDQSPLKDRKDVLRFVSEPLREPLTITGKVWADIHFSTNVEDTLFVVKLVDIYPDGYEAIVRESAGMARYAEGLDGQTPLKEHQTYALRMDLWSTALAFNKGHRIGVYVTSSSAFKDKKGKLKEIYEIHPNSFKQVETLEGAPKAQQTIHMSANAPSRIILPVVQ